MELLKEWLKTPFQFAAMPVSVLAVLIYGSVFTAVSITDQTPAVPKDLGGLNLSQAYENLHIVSQICLCIPLPPETC